MSSIFSGNGVLVLVEGMEEGGAMGVQGDRAIPGRVHMNTVGLSLSKGKSCVIIEFGRRGNRKPQNIARNVLNAQLCQIRTPYSNATILNISL